MLRIGYRMGAWAELINEGNPSSLRYSSESYLVALKGSNSSGGFL